MSTPFLKKKQSDEDFLITSVMSTNCEWRQQHDKEAYAKYLLENDCFQTGNNKSAGRRASVGQWKDATRLRVLITNELYYPVVRILCSSHKEILILESRLEVSIRKSGWYSSLATRTSWWP
jgi:hypothetical protein